jgi:pilus assembly protein Flp/PilA
MLILRHFWKDETAATAIEYGIIAGLISVAIIGSAGSVGSKLSNTFSNIAARLN